jgi:fucose permease
MKRFQHLLLLAVIYLAFVSLGLPDSVFGVAWPAMRLDWREPVEAAGLVTLLITACSALSGFASGYVLRRLGTGRVVFLSGLLTGGALLGLSLIPDYAWIFAIALPLGFGAGSVDAALNHFVAAHYSSRHMSWLHASWGIGATIGPLIMGSALAAGRGSDGLGAVLQAGAGWQSGYRLIGAIQLGLAVILFLSMPLWRREDLRAASEASEASRDTGATGSSAEDPAAGADGGGAIAAARLPTPAWATWLAPFLYFAYAAVEVGTGLWAATVLVETRGLQAAQAGFLVSSYYGAIMAGRILTGLVADRLGNRRMARAGLVLAILGAILFSIAALPLPLTVLGLALLGLGCAPVYPCLMHETPRRFDAETARLVVGRQVAFAYVGAAIVPAAFGLLGAALGPGVIMPAVALAALILLGLTEALNAVT